MREKLFPFSLTQFNQLNSPQHGLLLNTSLHQCVWMLLYSFGTMSDSILSFSTLAGPRAHESLTEVQSILLSNSLRSGIAVQSPVQAPKFLVHGLFPNFISWALQWITHIWRGNKVVEISSICVPLELPFCLRWCERCTEQWKIKCLPCPVIGYHLPVLMAQQKWALFLKPLTETCPCQ